MSLLAENYPSFWQRTFKGKLGKAIWIIQFFQVTVWMLFIKFPLIPFRFEVIYCEFCISFNVRKMNITPRLTNVIWKVSRYIHTDALQDTIYLLHVDGNSLEIKIMFKRLSCLHPSALTSFIRVYDKIISHFGSREGKFLRFFFFYSFQSCAVPESTKIRGCREQLSKSHPFSTVACRYLKISCRSRWSDDENIYVSPCALMW